MEDLADAAAGVRSPGRDAAHLVEDGFEDGEAGVDDAEEGFEGGEHGDDGVGVLRVGGGDRGGVVDAVEGDGADTTGAAFISMSWRNLVLVAGIGR